MPPPCGTAHTGPRAPAGRDLRVPRTRRPCRRSASRRTCASRAQSAPPVSDLLRTCASRAHCARCQRPTSREAALPAHLSASPAPSRLAPGSAAGALTARAARGRASTDNNAPSDPSVVERGPDRRCLRTPRPPRPSGMPDLCAARAESADPSPARRPCARHAQVLHEPHRLGGSECARHAQDLPTSIARAADLCAARAGSDEPPSRPEGARGARPTCPERAPSAGGRSYRRGVDDRDRLPVPRWGPELEEQNWEFARVVLDQLLPVVVQLHRANAVELGLDPSMLADPRRPGDRRTRCRSPSSPGGAP